MIEWDWLSMSAGCFVVLFSGREWTLCYLWGRGCFWWWDWELSCTDSNCIDDIAENSIEKIYKVWFGT